MAEVAVMAGMERVPQLEQNPALTISQVADYLGVSGYTVHLWCRSGKMPGFRLGREWRVRLADLDAWIRGGGIGAERQ